MANIVQLEGIKMFASILRMISLLFLGLFHFSCSEVVFAGSGGIPTPPASEYMQFIQNINLIESVVKQAQAIKIQIEQLQIQAKNFARTPQNVWTDITGTLRELDSIVRRGQAVSYTLENIEAEFRRKYPGYAPQEDFVKAHKDWSDTTLDSIRNALEAAGFQNSEFQTEASTLRTIENLSDSAEGQNQILQAANSIAAQEVIQLMKLRQLQLSQSQAANNYFAYEVNKDAAQNAAVDQFIQLIEYNGGAKRY